MVVITPKVIDYCPFACGTGFRCPGWVGSDMWADIVDISIQHMANRVCEPSKKKIVWREFLFVFTENSKGYKGY